MKTGVVNLNVSMQRYDLNKTIRYACIWYVVKEMRYVVLEIRLGATKRDEIECNVMTNMRLNAMIEPIVW